MKYFPLGLILFTGALSSTATAQSVPTPSGSTGAPAQNILAANCSMCHGQSHMSDLDVRDRSSLLKGGKRGPAIVPGKSADSLLFHAIKRDGALKMPPGGKALSAADVDTIRKWIDGGAPWNSAAPVQQSTWWSFRKPVRPPVPAVKDQAWVKNPIDAFILARLEKEGLRPSPEADRRTLIRRASFDLLGLPPDPKDVEQFVNDKSPDAWEKLVDRYLASPRYGERWARYWLDLVRYADTSGFETDHFFPNGWRYRDYVIDSFNKDKPYTTFVQEQIAADEIWPDNLELEGGIHLSAKKQEDVNRRIGTSMYTVGSFPIEFTYYGDQWRAEWESDATDVTGAAFMGLTFGCARCHDHKFDPIKQKDYYSLSAFFAGSEEREIPLVSQFDILTYTRSMPLISQAEAMKHMLRGGGRGGAARRADGSAKVDAAGDAGQQNAANTQANAQADAPPARSGAATTPERAAMFQKLGELYARLPDHYATANVLAHSEFMPETHILGKGDFKSVGAKVEPAFPSFLNPGPPIEEPMNGPFVPQRRKALALWLTSPDHPLLSRVMVNRIWQGHFGEGIVRTPNDFGRQGDPPTHPELLDWLATEFASRGYSIKQMHRLIMLSNTYRMSSVATPENFRKDPDNFLLSRMNRQRLNADELRDTMLATSGNLNLKMGGMGIIVPLTKEEIEAARMPNLWPPNPDPREYNRRTIYLQMKRSMTLPMLQTFDAPDTALSCPRRDTSTVAPQALTLMNSDFSVAEADKFAELLVKESGNDTEAQVRNAWRRAFGRVPKDDVDKMALDYLSRNSLSRLCLLIFNMNEFVYVD
jgi:hypothetical protein